MPSGTYERKPMSEETKRKIGLANSIALKGMKISKNRIEKIRQRMLVDNPMWKKENKIKVSEKLTGIKRARGWLNKNWKGDNITYFHFHRWLKDNYGKANKCENVNCEKKSKNYEWSLLKGKKLQRKIENFWQLCTSCHRKYDYTNDQRLKLRLSHIGQKPWNKGYSKGRRIKKRGRESLREVYK